MVSMQANSQLYDLSYTYKRPLCQVPAIKYEDYGTIYDVLRKSGNYKKTVALIEKAGMSLFYRQVGGVNGTEGAGTTLFVTTDSHIPDKFVESANLYTAMTFLKSYTFTGVAHIDYLVKNGTSVYNTLSDDNPVLCVVKTDGGKSVEISINRVGRVVKEFKTSNGNIIELDNIAQVGYVN
jgi:hypothetical protein